MLDYEAQRNYWTLLALHYLEKPFRDFDSLTATWNSKLAELERNQGRFFFFLRPSKRREKKRPKPGAKSERVLHTHREDGYHGAVVTHDVDDLVHTT